MKHSLWKERLKTDHIEETVNRRQFSSSRIFCSWEVEEMSRGPLQLWPAPPCEGAAISGGSPEKTKWHSTTTWLETLEKTLLQSRGRLLCCLSMSAAGWKGFTLFQLWHLILGRHDFLIWVKQDRQSYISKRTRNVILHPLHVFIWVCFCRLHRAIGLIFRGSQFYAVSNVWRGNKFLNLLIVWVIHERCESIPLVVCRWSP